MDCEVDAQVVFIKVNDSETVDPIVVGFLLDHDVYDSLPAIVGVFELGRVVE